MIERPKYDYDLVPGMRVIVEQWSSENQYQTLELPDKTGRNVIHWVVPEDKIVALL